MIRHDLPWQWVLLCCALAACATTSPSGIEIPDDAAAGQVVSFEEACAEDSSLLALCAGERCGLYRCREVMAQEEAGRVVLTRGGALMLPGPQVGVRRYWGSAQELPQDSRPVFIIPWNHRPELLPSQKQMLEEQAAEREASTGERMEARGMLPGASSSRY
jgi:hypothetical protein